MDKPARRMILVSNRLPITTEQLPNGQFVVHKSSGGLVAGLSEIHQAEDTIWVGHCGLYSTDSGYATLKQQLAADRLIAVDLPQADYSAYYNNTCNRLLWPLSHYFPDFIHFSPEDWAAYERVNQRFAAAVMTIAEPGDHIWVHDYQLMLLPALLRHAQPNLSIAYFHHIPFPTSELFRILQPRTAILEGLLGADMIGFHTHDYVRHFLTSVKRILGSTTHLDHIHHQDRRIKVVAQPLGVDVRMIQQHGTTQHITPSPQVMQLAQHNNNRTVLLGVDRLDYTKGIPERLLAFRQLLQRYPQYRGQVTLLQISVPSRSEVHNYAELRAEVERLVGQINGEFATPDYTPIQYLYRGFSQAEIIAFYKLAQIAVVTPLRDGLNLVCKEYVAAHDDGDGVLILSEMAGAAAEMGEALLVNPYDIYGLAEAMHTALTMPEAERRHRMAHLRNRVMEHDNIAWLRAIKQDWHDVAQRNHSLSTSLQGTAHNQLLTTIAQTKRCFIFLDYDSALLNPVRQTDNTHMELLHALGNIPNIELAVITDRSQQFCAQHFGRCAVHLVAENGAYLRLHNRGEDWEIPHGVEEFSAIEADVMRLLEHYTQCVAGSYIENKSFALAWHFGAADATFAHSQAHDLAVALAQLLENTLFGVISDQEKVEVRPVIANKGHAIAHILHYLHRNPDDLLITIGAPTLYADVVQVIPNHTLAFHIEAPGLFAKYHFDSAESTQQLLRQFEIRSTQIM